MWAVTMFFAVLSLQIIPCAPAFAQVVMDGTVGREGPVPGPAYKITEDMGAVRGNNLFHSFKTFSIHQGESAIFKGPDGLANVISRVTGGEVSTIDGQLISKVPNADFWFINPAGVIFGPHAKVHVPAAFHVSTADELRFADGARFAATDPEASTLTSAQPEAFGFLGRQPGRIRLSGTFLSFEESQTVSLIGGDIEMDKKATLFRRRSDVRASNVHWNLIGVRGPGEVTLTASGTAVSRVEGSAGITMKDSTVRVFNTVNNTGGIHIEADRVALEESSTIQITAIMDAVSGRHGGDIEVRARSMEVLDGSRVTNTASAGEGGAVIIDVDKLLVSGRADPFPSEISARSQNVGHSGGVTVQAEDVELRNGGLITAQSLTSSDAGRIIISAPERLTLRGGSITTEALEADGGQIDIRVGELIHMEGSEITTTVAGGTGNAGNIFIDPTFLVMENSRIEAKALGGQGGNIDIIADFIIRDPASIIDATSAAGPRLSGTVTLSGPEADLAGTIAVPTPDFLDASSLLAETCPGRSGQPRSGLVQGGRGGLPADPTRPRHATLIADRMPDDRQSMGMGESAGVSEARVPAPTEADPAWVAADRTKRSILCGP